MCVAILIGAVGVGSLDAEEEVIILGKGKTEALAEWDKPIHFGTGIWKVVDDAENQAIMLRTESSSFALEKSITVDLGQTPYLEWEWKVTVPPARGKFSSPDTDDQAAQLLVVFPRRSSSVGKSSATSGTRLRQKGQSGPPPVLFT